MRTGIGSSAKFSFRVLYRNLRLENGLLDERLLKENFCNSSTCIGCIKLLIRNVRVALKLGGKPVGRRRECGARYAGARDDGRETRQAKRRTEV